MCLSPNLLQGELWPRLSDKGLLIVAHDSEFAALWWPIHRKGGNDNRAAGMQGAPQGRDVPATVLRGDQKMECCPVIPEAKAMRSSNVATSVINIHTNTFVSLQELA